MLSTSDEVFLVHVHAFKGVYQTKQSAGPHKISMHLISIVTCLGADKLNPAVAGPMEQTGDLEGQLPALMIEPLHEPNEGGLHSQPPWLVDQLESRLENQPHHLSP